MANEAFALSPISARAAEPNEADYEAIRDAFMETARGRWFLGEYAKRNRNADTSMVLDAVARIEETLAAQRQPVVEDRLPEALIAIRRAIREAETVAIGAFDPAALETSLSPIQRGVRIIKEISWRWREIGADGRICDLIDSQLAAIEGACAQVSTIDPRADLTAAFDLLRDQVDRTEAGGTDAKQQDAAPVRRAPAQAAPEPTEVAAAPVETPPVEAEAAMTSEAPATVAVMPEQIVAAAEPEIAAASADISETMDEAAATDVVGEAEIIVDDHVAIEDSIIEPEPVAEQLEEPLLDAAAEAEDEAILDAIALEMAAPDPDFDEVIEESAMAAAPVEEPIAASEPPIPAESLARLGDAIAEAAAAVMERPASVMAPAMAQAPAPVPAMTQSPLPMPTPLPTPSPVSEPSLGATILASGMLQTPRAANDPLAPIRRMTQAEKIAFFS